MAYFEITGGNQLNGTVTVPGAKNAALPMLCASLLTQEKCIFHEVPNIADIQTLLEIFETIGATITHNPHKRIVEIEAKHLDPSLLPSCRQAKKMRATLLLMGPLLARFGEVEIPQPGGCVIGARSNSIHVEGLTVLGAQNSSTPENIHLQFKSKKLKEHRLLLPEASVTGTENLAMFLAGKEDFCEIYFSAAESHVCATLNMLVKMGAEIEGIGTHHLKIKGPYRLKGGTFTIPPDGILVGTYALAGILSHGNLSIQNVNHQELFSFYGLLKRTGALFEMKENHLKISPTKKLHAITKIQTGIYPSFSTDLQSPMGVLLTQCEGTSQIFETLFENRLTYLYELEKMGADIKIRNEHQARIMGPTPLKGTQVTSWDLRAGAAMVLAGLIAKGTTKVTNIEYIDRGYENFVENLQNLGAKIFRRNELTPETNPDYILPRN